MIHPLLTEAQSLAEAGDYLEAFKLCEQYTAIRHSENWDSRNGQDESDCVLWDLTSDERMNEWFDQTGD